MLTHSQILKAVSKKEIVIEPFEIGNIGENSYDVHLGKWLAVYKDEILDAKKNNELEYIEIPEEGIILKPNQFYLGVTKEYTETWNAVPCLDGLSSTGRLGLDIHSTACFGDVGFCGRWTLEISCRKEVRVYKNMPIGEIVYFPISGEIDLKKLKEKSMYGNTIDNERPIGSMLWKKKFFNGDE